MAGSDPAWTRLRMLWCLGQRSASAGKDYTGLAGLIRRKLLYWTAIGL